MDMRVLSHCKICNRIIRHELSGPTTAHEEQSREFLIRAEVQKPFEVIASSTRISAEILCQEGKLGIIAAGAIADLLVIDGNPLDDLGLLQDQGRHMPVIMQAGKLHKNLL